MLTKKWTTNLAAAYVLAAVFYTTVANAVGFGDITLNTALNEPLDAEISLTNVEAIDTDLLVKDYSVNILNNLDDLIKVIK